MNNRGGITMVLPDVACHGYDGNYYWHCYLTDNVTTEWDHHDTDFWLECHTDDQPVVIPSHSSRRKEMKITAPWGYGQWILRDTTFYSHVFEDNVARHGWPEHKAVKDFSSGEIDSKAGYFHKLIIPGEFL